MSDSPLSGVAAPAAIALCPAQPLLSVEQTNRLLLRHGLNRELARALVHDAVAAAIPLNPEDELPLVAAYLQSQGIASEADLERWLTAQHWSRDDLQAIATQAERLRRWSHWRFARDVEIRFLDRKLALDRVVYRLLQVQEQELAEELHQRLRGREMDAAALVEQFSLGPERDSQGLVGPVAVAATPMPLQVRLRAGREGQLWPPFPMGERWCVLRLERQLPAQLDGGTRELLLHELFSSWVDSQVEGLLQGAALPVLPSPGEGEQP